MIGLFPCRPFSCILKTSTGAGQAFLLRCIDWFAGIAAATTDSNLIGIVPFHQFRNIKFGLLQYLDLTDVTILDREDTRTLLRDRVTDRGGNQFLDERLQIALGAQFRHDRRHLGTDGTALRRFGVARRRNLIVLRPRERDTEQPDDVPVGRSAVHVGFDDRLLLPDQRTQLVTGHVHPVEVQQTVVPLDVLDTELDLTVRERLVLLKVRQRHLDDTALQVVGRDLRALSLGNQRLATVLDDEDRRRLEFVPFLLEERVNGLLTATLFGFGQSLILALSLLLLLLLLLEDDRSNEGKCERDGNGGQKTIGRNFDERRPETIKKQERLEMEGVRRCMGRRTKARMAGTERNCDLCH